MFGIRSMSEHREREALPTLSIRRLPPDTYLASPGGRRGAFHILRHSRTCRRGTYHFYQSVLASLGLQFSRTLDVHRRTSLAKRRKSLGTTAKHRNLNRFVPSLVCPRRAPGIPGQINHSSSARPGASPARLIPPVVGYPLLGGARRPFLPPYPDTLVLLTEAAPDPPSSDWKVYPLVLVVCLRKPDSALGHGASVTCFVLGADLPQCHPACRSAWVDKPAGREEALL